MPRPKRPAPRPSQPMGAACDLDYMQQRRVEMDARRAARQAARDAHDAAAAMPPGPDRDAALEAARAQAAAL